MAAPSEPRFTPLWALSGDPRMKRQQRRARLAAIPLVLIFVAVAVSIIFFHTSAAPAATPAVTDPLTAATGTPEAIRVTRSDLLPARVTAGLTSVPWRLTGVSADGRIITIDASRGGGCTVPRGFSLTQTAESVEIWSFVKTVRSVGSARCPDTVAHGSFSFTLAAPLGSRHLLHPPYDHDWSVG
jgi:hypothetical protein